MQVQQNKTSPWSYADSHPSDKKQKRPARPEGSPAPRWGTVFSPRVGNDGVGLTCRLQRLARRQRDMAGIKRG